MNGDLTKGGSQVRIYAHLIYLRALVCIKPIFENNHRGL